MGDLLMRRREMVLHDQVSPIVCPYITDGLIFWLDGIERGGIAGQWKDLIGGKIFVLNNVIEGTDCVHFNGANTSYGLCSGPVSADFNSETIECAVSSFPTRATLLNPPLINGFVGIGLIRGTNKYSHGMDGVSRFMWNLGGFKAVSVNSDVAASNKVQRYKTGSEYWVANTSGDTYLGMLSTGTYCFSGDIYSLRIYNRKLSLAEMLQNQSVDNERFNLGL